MAIRKTAGAKLYIGGAHTVTSTAITSSTFSAETWVAVGSIIDLGEVGDQSDEITVDLIDWERRLRLKGMRDAGVMSVVVAATEDDDAGQEDMQDAEATEGNYAFKIEFDDDPGGSGSAPSIRYFAGLVMSSREAMGTANNVVQCTYQIAVNTNVVRVDPVAGS